MQIAMKTNVNDPRVVMHLNGRSRERPSKMMKPFSQIRFSPNYVNDRPSSDSQGTGDTRGLCRLKPAIMGTVVQNTLLHMSLRIRNAI